MPTFAGIRILAGEKDLRIIIEDTRYSDDDVSSKQFRGYIINKFWSELYLYVDDSDLHYVSDDPVFAHEN
jgi:hypothetical protein